MSSGSIWRNVKSIEELNKMSENTLQDHLNIKFIEIGDDYLKSKMPVDCRTHQPYGILHGGASVVLAETTGSVAAYMCIDQSLRCVGLDINANHLRIVKSGFIYCVAKPIHIGQKTQVWENAIMNDEGRLVCQSRLTVMVLKASFNH